MRRSCNGVTGNDYQFECGQFLVVFYFAKNKSINIRMFISKLWTVLIMQNLTNFHEMTDSSPQISTSTCIKSSCRNRVVKNWNKKLCKQKYCWPYQQGKTSCHHVPKEYHRLPRQNPTSKFSPRNRSQHLNEKSTCDTGLSLLAQSDLKMCL